MEPSSQPEMRMIDVLVAQHHFRYQKKTATERIQQSGSHFDKQGSLSAETLRPLEPAQQPEPNSANSLLSYIVDMISVDSFYISSLTISFFPLAQVKKAAKSEESGMSKKLGV